MTDKTDILAKLFSAADNHANEFGYQEHAVSDLQGLLEGAWAIMTVSQRLAFLEIPEVEALVEVGAEGDFTKEDLTEIVLESVITMEAAIRAAGYELLEAEFGFFWRTEDEEGLDCVERVDMIEDAFTHLSTSSKT